MMHAICAMLVLVLAVAEMKAIKDLAHQHAVVSIQQASAPSTFPSSYRASN